MARAILTGELDVSAPYLSTVGDDFKVNRSRLVILSLLALFLVACNLFSDPSPLTPTVLAPTGTPAATAPAVIPTRTTVGQSPTPPTGPCEIVAESEAIAYTRPSPNALVFGSMSPGFRVLAEGRTADGWLGFEPGVAQAANVGVFRLRWVEESSDVWLEGACGDLPELAGPPAGVCFTMPMNEVDVYAEPKVSSQVVITMMMGDYAAVIGSTADEWARVDLSVGNTGLEVSGWVQGSTLNLNGPCENLPTVEP